MIHSSIQELSACVWLEQWLASDQGILDQLNRLITQIDDDFLLERESSAFPDVFDFGFLKIYRASRVAQLLVFINDDYKEFLLARIQMPLKLPGLPETTAEKFINMLEVKNAA